MQSECCFHVERLNQQHLPFGQQHFPFWPYQEQMSGASYREACWGLCVEGDQLLNSRTCQFQHLNEPSPDLPTLHLPSALRQCLSQHTIGRTAGLAWLGMSLSGGTDMYATEHAGL